MTLHVDDISSASTSIEETDSALKDQYSSPNQCIGGLLWELGAESILKIPGLV